jgi:hypothetical protein
MKCKKLNYKSKVIRDGVHKHLWDIFCLTFQQIMQNLLHTF